MMHTRSIVVGAFEVNCLVVWEGRKEAIVFDPGADPDLISQVIENEGLTVAAIMLTHGHVDHISALADLCDRYGAPVGMHPKERESAFGPHSAMLPFCGVPRKPEEISRDLADGETWKDGGLAYRVIETPGHSPGSVCFYFEADKVLICGDTLFAGSVGRTDLPGGDSRTLSASLAKLAELPDDVQAWPGHGPVTTIGEEKRSNFFMLSSPPV